MSKILCQVCAGAGVLVTQGNRGQGKVPRLVDRENSLLHCLKVLVMAVREEGVVGSGMLVLKIGVRLVLKIGGVLVLKLVRCWS